MSGEVDAPVVFGKPKKRLGRIKAREGSKEDSALEPLSEPLSGSPSSPNDISPPLIHTKKKVKHGLSFDSPEESEDAFQLQKKGVKAKGKKSFGKSTFLPSDEVNSGLVEDDMYSEANLKKLKEENAVQFVVKPLKRGNKDYFEEESLQDATGLVEDSRGDNAMDVQVVDEVDEEEEDEWVKKQVEKAKELRNQKSRRLVLDQYLDKDATGELSSSVPSRGLKSDAMDVDEEGEEEGEEQIDDEAEERDALGLANTGRHYFEDAVEKHKPVLEVAASEWEREIDEDEIMWEMELIKRSGVKRQHQTIGGAPQRALESVSRTHKRVDKLEIPERLVQPWSEDELLRRLESELSQLEATYVLNENRLGNVESAQREHFNFLKNADSALAQATADLTFFEEFKVYMINLMECLESKSAAIEALEGQIFAARVKKTKKSQILISNALQDGFIHSDAKHTLPPRLDSPFQRWITLLNLKMDKKALEVIFDISDPQWHTLPGYDSDSESTEHDLDGYHSDLHSIADEARKVFEDTKADFCDLQLIFQHIALCRQRYPISYKQSHLEEQLKELISPIVKLEMLPWDPLQNPNLFDWPWFQITDQYMLDAQSTHSEQPSSQNNSHSTSQNGNNTPIAFDQHLINDIAAIVYVPKIMDAIKHFWRVNSMKESQNLQNLLKNAKLLLLDSKPLAQILQAIHASITHAISSINFPTSFHTSKESYHLVVFFRSLKLLSIILEWDSFFSPLTISSLVWEKMVNGKIIPYLRVILKAKEFSLLWAFLRYLIAAIKPYYSKHKTDIKGQGIDGELALIMTMAEEESMAHFDSFEMQQSVLSFWKDMYHQ